MWIAGVTALAGCNADGDDGGAAFEPAQLPGLVAQPADAPAGMHYDESQSGPAPLGVLSQDVAAAQQQFEQLGFQGGYTAIFVSTDDQPPAGDVIGVGVFAFDDSTAADEALDVHKNVVIPARMTDYEEITANDLGDEAFAFTFAEGPNGGPGTIYAFRARNAVFLVPGSGHQLDRDAVLTLAQTVAARLRQ